MKAVKILCDTGNHKYDTIYRMLIICNYKHVSADVDHAKDLASGFLDAAFHQGYQFPYPV